MPPSTFGCDGPAATCSFSRARPVWTPAQLHFPLSSVNDHNSQQAGGTQGQGGASCRRGRQAAQAGRGNVRRAKQNTQASELGLQTSRRDGKHAVAAPDGSAGQLELMCLKGGKTEAMCRAGAAASLPPLARRPHAHAPLITIHWHSAPPTLASPPPFQVNVHECAACGAVGGSKRTASGETVARKQCARCRRAFHCSADCQRSHWPSHKEQCRQQRRA